MNWRGLGRAVLWTQLISWSVSIFKAEATIRIAWWTQDPVWTRAAAYGLGIGLTLLFAPLSAWLAWRLQR